MFYVKNIKKIFLKFFLSNENFARYLGVSIGRNCDIQNVSFGSEPYLIEIGDYVQITNGTKIFTHGAAWVFRREFKDFDFFGRVIIKNNVYIGNNVIILPGVTIGNDVIVGAGCVVSKSVPDGKVVVGNPMRIVGEVSELKDKMMSYNVKSKGLSYQRKREFLLSLTSERFIVKQ
jgi:acetyltransferase-like isoleucine patch superfamily enzyme